MFAKKQYTKAPDDNVKDMSPKINVWKIIIPSHEGVPEFFYYSTNPDEDYEKLEAGKRALRERLKNKISTYQLMEAKHPNHALQSKYNIVSREIPWSKWTKEKISTTTYKYERMLIDGEFPDTFDCRCLNRFPARRNLDEFGRIKTTNAATQKDWQWTLRNKLEEELRIKYALEGLVELRDFDKRKKKTEAASHVKTYKTQMMKAIEKAVEQTKFDVYDTLVSNE